MGKDTRAWRKQVKKLRRSRNRRDRALQKIADCPSEASPPEETQAEEDKDLIGEAEWILREEQAQMEFRMKQALEQTRIIIRLANEKKIREEWELIKNAQEEAAKKKEEEDKERSARQEQEFEHLLDFLSGDIENPPQPFLMPEVLEDGREVCAYFAKTGACRFYDRCERTHAKPTLSSIILIQNFFSHFSLEQSLRDEFDTDLSLEYEDKDMNHQFLEFYEDVMPELRKAGSVIQFKACCNFVPHLRGNVYVQYENVREAVQAYRTFNARYYNARQLTLQFVRIPSWKSAICGLFSRRRCTKGSACNFLHVFRNPTKEFVAADNDWALPSGRESRDPINKNAYAHHGERARSKDLSLHEAGSSNRSKYFPTMRYSPAKRKERKRERSKSKEGKHSKRHRIRTADTHSPTQSRRNREKRKHTLSGRNTPKKPEENDKYSHMNETENEDRTAEPSARTEATRTGTDSRRSSKKKKHKSESSRDHRKPIAHQSKSKHKHSKVRRD